MSDDTPQPPKPPTPPTPSTPSTPPSPGGSTPLKKETVRITVKPDSGGGAPAPSAPRPPAAAPSPGAPKPPGAVPSAPPGAPAKKAAMPPAKKVAAAKTAPLPKATVKLQAAPAMPQAPRLAGVSANVADEDGGEESGLVPIAIILFIVSLVLLGLQVMNYLQA